MRRPDPQRQLERLTSERLTPTEYLRIYPRTVIIPPTLAALILLAIFVPGTVGTLSAVLAATLGIVSFIAAPWVFEGFYNSRSQARVLANKREALAQQRPLRKGQSVLAVPDGEYVTIHTWGKPTFDRSPHMSKRFHAEDEAEAAQDYVAEFRARAQHETDDGPSPDAQALAKALNA